MNNSHNSFLNRASRTFVKLGLIPTLLVLFVYSAHTIYKGYNDFQKELRLEASQILRQINGYCENLKFISDEILYRSNFYNSARELKYQSGTEIELKENMRNLISTISNYSSFQDTYNVIYLTEGGYYYNLNATPKGSTQIYKVNEEQIGLCDWYSKTLKKKSELVWTFLDDDSIIPEIKENNFSLIRAIHVPTETGGYLITQMKVSDILPSFDKIFEYGGEVLLLDEDGNVLYDTAKDISDKNFNSGKVLKLENVSEKYGLKLQINVPYQVLWEQIWYQVFPVILISILVIICVILVNRQYAKSFSEPMILLTKQIKNVTLENLDDQEMVDLKDASDEIQYLSRVFYDMSVRLQKMISEKMVQQKMQAELKYRVLQYQINPHFIYNTLDIIGIMGYENDGENVYQACQMLAKIMRYSLKNASSGTTFQQEFDNLDTYLKLMKLRYEHKILFELQLDEKLRNFRLPYFILQPLAENVFAHGFDLEHPVIELKVQAHMESNGKWHILAEDDGCAVPDEKIQEIQWEVSQLIEKGNLSTDNEKNIHGIGLKNILVRLYYFYGESFQYTICRKDDGNGCVIHLSGELREG